MTHLFTNAEWRNLLTEIALSPNGDNAPRLAAADLLQAGGEPIRAAYIRSCCAGTSDCTIVTDTLPTGTEFTPLSGWVPQGELLCYWERGFIARVLGPLELVRRELPRLLLREPLYQSPDGPEVVSVSDRASLQVTDESGHDHWTWGSLSSNAEDTVVADAGPLLPPEVFELLPWPPMFDTARTAARALSSALLSEAQERLTEASDFNRR